MKKLIEGVDYFIYFMRFPPTIFSCVATNPDGTFTIYLDPRRTAFQQAKDLKHEIDHILKNDFYNNKPIQMVENYL